MSFENQSGFGVWLHNCCLMRAEVGAKRRKPRSWSLMGRTRWVSNQVSAGMNGTIRRRQHGTLS